MSIFTPFKFRYDLWRDGAPSRKGYGVSYFKQCEEAWHLFKLNQLEPYEFSNFHLSEPSLTLADKENFLSYNQTCILNREINPRHARGVLNKFVFEPYMKAVGVRTPKNYALFDPQHGYCLDGNPFRTAHDVKSLLNRYDLHEFVLKPASSAKGKGITVIKERVGDKFIAGDDQEYDYEGIYRILLAGFETGLPHSRDSVTLQERIKQHTAIDAIFPNCLNCVRIVALLGLDGRIELLGTIMKFGRGKAMVDNTYQGGIAGKINEDGTLGPIVNFSSQSIEYSDQHPDTHAQITGVKLPYYEETKAIACEVQRNVPQLRSLGFDIGITPDGPVIIEGNAWWSHIGQAFMRRGYITPNMRVILDQIM